MLYSCTTMAIVGVKGLMGWMVGRLVSWMCVYINILLDTVLANPIKAKSSNHW